MLVSAQDSTFSLQNQPKTSGQGSGVRIFEYFSVNIGMANYVRRDCTFFVRLLWKVPHGLGLGGSLLR